VPTQAQIEDLFLFGKVEPSQLARDLSNGASEYHIQRSAIKQSLRAIADGARILLLDGYPCDGKTLLVADLAYSLSGERLVYKLSQAYDNVLNEVADILHHAPNAALIIENCFDIPTDRLASIARQFDGHEGVLILTSRAIAVDASPAGLSSLQGFSSFRRMPLVSLDEFEAGALSNLADQIAGWRDFYTLNADARLLFIQKTCHASLPHFLMRLLGSDYVTTRYREEFNKLSLSPDERSAIIISLYFTHIGEIAPVSFLSNAMKIDFGAIIDGLNAIVGNSAFRLVRRVGNTIQTVPSIGAQNILKSLFHDGEIVDSIVEFLKNIASQRRTYFEQRIFGQLMRFTILSEVVTDKYQINRFFEHNKQEPQIRRMPLFWLQWHMAKCATGELLDAEKFLEQGYSEAKELERRSGNIFDRIQLDDRRAKFLVLRTEKTGRVGAELFNDLKEAIEITGRILRQSEPQHYPFETLAEIVRTYGLVGHRLDDGLREIIKRWIRQLASDARNRIGRLPSGFQTERALSALKKVELQL
jgi:hypothetical protein